MTALKQTKSSTALVRVLALPIMMGALAGCDYASKLPDAPSALGGYDMTQKPPSVTGSRELDRLPPPPNALAGLKGSVEDRTKEAAADAMAQKVVAEAQAEEAPEQPKPLDQIAFKPLEFEAIEAPSNTQVAESEFSAPPLDIPAPSYTPESQQVAQAPIYQPYDAQGQTLEIVPMETYAVEGTPGQTQAVAYEPAPAQPIQYDSVPVDSYAIAAAPTPAPVQYERTPATRSASPVAIQRTRLPNGAVVNVHPIIGAPGAASGALARTVVTGIGTQIDEDTARNAEVVFDLRGRAERNTDGYVAVEWALFDANQKAVGLFPERQNGENWSQMSDASLRAMGQRVADRIARNGALRKSTLYAAATPTRGGATMAPIGESTTTYVMQTGATLAQAPLPRVSPRAATTYSAPTPVAARPAPRPVVAPAPRPLVAAAPKPQPRVVTQAPTTPVRAIPQAPQVTASTPTRPVAPPPSFPTLRAVDATPAAPTPVAAPTVVASGPRPLVFRGVQGAPGDGDQALGREVSKLLQASGARMTNTPQPGALFLTAEVSKTSGSNSDRIEIIWRVQDGSGESIGQVSQENELPRGMLDNAWGDNAVYAAQGARDGIIQLLQSVNALES